MRMISLRMQAVIFLSPGRSPGQGESNLVQVNFFRGPGRTNRRASPRPASQIETRCRNSLQASAIRAHVHCWACSIGTKVHLFCRPGYANDHRFNEVCHCMRKPPVQGVPCRATRFNRPASLSHQRLVTFPVPIPYPDLP